jgi:NAD(P)H dehydrogenase (quinone)
MGKVLVLFDSATGHTSRMAELVAEGAARVADTEIRLLDIERATAGDIAWCDGIAVGTPTNMGVLSWKMKRFWDETAVDLWGKIDGKIGCAFSSSGGIGGGSEIACMSVLTILMNFGLLVFGVTDYVTKGWTLHYGAITAGEPREEKELEACRVLGARLAQWVAVLAENRADMHPLVKKA